MQSILRRYDDEEYHLSDYSDAQDSNGLKHGLIGDTSRHSSSLWSKTTRQQKILYLVALLCLFGCIPLLFSPVNTPVIHPTTSATSTNAATFNSVQYNAAENDYEVDRDTNKLQSSTDKTNRIGTATSTSTTVPNTAATTTTATSMKDQLTQTIATEMDVVEESQDDMNSIEEMQRDAKVLQQEMKQMQKMIEKLETNIFREEQKVVHHHQRNETVESTTTMRTSISSEDSKP